ncbi:2-amino-4-hydroxy-6-hydroxymethyldihydropteridine diphosphokinase [bacterium]|nr:2-amino-4-hydroxy-6-hydroxymethyldihydropteridine diphosphokinase [bacterium]
MSRVYAVIAYLGLGSNLGNRLANLREAVDRLAMVHGVVIQKISPVYETLPEGGPEQPDYLNAAVEIGTSLDAVLLLGACSAIEDDMGRIRGERWGPRTIDIDILLYGGARISTDRLTVPHPRMHERAFVLQPLADIAPDAVHPPTGLTVGELLGRAGASGIRKMENMKLKIKE